MTEYIEREALKKVLTRYLSAPHVQIGHSVGQGMRIAIKSCIELLDNEYAADVAQVVRCKHCKHRGWVQEPCHGKSVDFCRVWDSCINNIDKCFCYYGERKEGDANDCKTNEKAADGCRCTEKCGE